MESEGETLDRVKNDIAADLMETMMRFGDGGRGDKVAGSVTVDGVVSGSDGIADSVGDAGSPGKLSQRGDGAGNGDGQQQAATKEMPTALGCDESESMPTWKSDGVIISEGVVKEIIKEGSGSTPPTSATCTVNFRAWIAETKQKILDSREDRQTYELSFGHESHGEKGLALGVASMRAGEKCLLRVSWEKAYGKDGNFSFPHVPPQADLEYEVELVGFDTEEEGRHRSEMTVEERCAAAEKRRQAGNTLFKEGKIEEAAKKYEMALSYMGEEFMFQLEGKYRDLANSARLPCHSNLAACYLKMERYGDVIQNCSTVLMEDEKNEKALYRRAKARIALGQTDAAKEDLAILSKFAPADAGVSRELRVIKEQETQLLKKQKQLYKGIFGDPPKSKAKPTWYARMWLFLLSVFAFLFRPFRRWQKVKTM